MQYLKFPIVSELFERADEYEHASFTEIRKPLPSEIGQELVTHPVSADVLNTLGLTHSHTGLIDAESVIFRKRDPSGQLQNEQLMSQKALAHLYGSIYPKMTTEFKTFRNIGPFKAIELTPLLLLLLAPGKNSLPIDAEWNQDGPPMVAKVGDYLTDQGYLIPQEEMTSHYRRVSGIGNLMENIIIQDNKPHKYIDKEIFDSGIFTQRPLNNFLFNDAKSIKPKEQPYITEIIKKHKL